MVVITHSLSMKAITHLNINLTQQSNYVDQGQLVRPTAKPCHNHT